VSGGRRSLARAALAAGLVVSGVLLASACAGETAQSATVPAATVLQVSPTGVDSGGCTSSPCLTFDYAYHLAKPGQTVEVAAGEYPSETITPDLRKTGPKLVLFKPAAGAAVIVDNLDIFGSHIEFRSMRLGWKAEKGADDLTFRAVSSSMLFIWSATNVRVLGGELYPGPNYLDGCTQDHNTCDYDSNISNAEGGPPPQHILFNGVFFHGWLRPPGTDFHTECLQVGSGIDVTIENSRFTDCATHDIFIRSWGPDFVLRDWMIQNNFFGATQDGYYSVNIGDTTGATYQNIVVRNNSALQDFASDVQTGTISFIGNIEPDMSSFKCGYAPAAKWDYNIYGSGTPCGRHDRIGDPKFVNAASLDLRVQPGSAAIGRGDPASFPPTDIARLQRPYGKLPDAGAYEFRP
jgi:hypothetical protein